jgi:peroxiredoxin
MKSKAEIHPALGMMLTRRAWIRNLALVYSPIGIAGADTRQAPDISGLGKKSPPLQVRTLDGQIIEIHKQAGKVVLVDFMTTTCPMCKQASAGIQKLYQEFGSQGFLPVALALDSNAASVLPLYRNLYGLTFPVGMIAREEVLRYLDHPADKLMMVPTLVLLDKRGRIAKKQVGWTGEPELRTIIAGLLRQKK